MATDIGTGTTITFPAGMTITAEILNVSWDGAERGVVQTSHMGTTTWHTKLLSDLADPGAFEIECHFKGGEDPPLGATGTVTISFPDGTNIVGNMGVRAFAMNDPLEDVMTSTYTLEALGAITLS